MYKRTDSIKGMGAGLIDGMNISFRWTKECLSLCDGLLLHQVYVWLHVYMIAKLLLWYISKAGCCCKLLRLERSCIHNQRTSSTICLDKDRRRKPNCQPNFNTSSTENPTRWLSDKKAKISSKYWRKKSAMCGISLLCPLCMLIMLEHAVFHQIQMINIQQPTSQDWFWFLSFVLIYSSLSV